HFAQSPAERAIALVRSGEEVHDEFRPATDGGRAAELADVPIRLRRTHPSDVATAVWHGGRDRRRVFGRHRAGDGSVLLHARRNRGFLAGKLGHRVPGRRFRWTAPTLRISDRKTVWWIRQ